MDQEELNELVKLLMNAVRKEIAPIISRLDAVETRLDDRDSADHAKRMRVISEIKAERARKAKAADALAAEMRRSNIRRGIVNPVVVKYR